MVQIRRRCTRATVRYLFAPPPPPHSSSSLSLHPHLPPFPSFLSFSLCSFLGSNATTIVNLPAKKCGLASTSSPPSKPKKTATKSVATWPTKRAKRPFWVIMPAFTMVIGGQRLHLLLRRQRGLRNKGRGKKGGKDTGGGMAWMNGACGA